MKKLMQITIIIAVAGMLSGCISRTIGVNTVASYEKRYEQGADIKIDGKQIDIPAGKSVWVLRNDTLEVLMSTAADKCVSKIK